MNGIPIQLNLIPINLSLLQQWNWIQIQLKKMGWKLVEKILKICLWIWCWKTKTKKRHKSKKTQFHAPITSYHHEKNTSYHHEKNKNILKITIYTYINSLSPSVGPWVIGCSGCIFYGGTGRTDSFPHPCARGSDR